MSENARHTRPRLEAEMISDSANLSSLSFYVKEENFTRGESEKSTIQVQNS